MNIFVWAAGRGNFRNRLDSPYIRRSLVSAANRERCAIEIQWLVGPRALCVDAFARYFKRANRHRDKSEYDRNEGFEARRLSTCRADRFDHRQFFAEISCA